MFLEAILYFVIGFLSAGLLALMISPVIWNRAVVLTKHKIESSVPLTLNEIQAEKDQLRAEFAMSTRRLESNLEQLRDKLAARDIEVNYKRDQVSKLDMHNQEYSKNLKLLKDEKIELVAKVNEHSSEFNAMKSQYDALDKNAKNITLEVQDLRDRLADKEELINSMRIELAAKNAKIEALNPDGNAVEEENPFRNEIDRLNSELAEQRAHNVELEAKLAGHALKMEAIAENATDKDIKEAVSVLQDNIKMKSNRIDAIEKERDSLVEEVKALSTITREEWSNERKNSAILRERINDMAAKIAVLAQEIDGEASPIARIIADEPKAKTRKNAKNGGTLAARIQALQETASVS